MKEYDDSPVPENESEDLTVMIVDAIKHLGDECKAAFKDRDAVIRGLEDRIDALETKNRASKRRLAVLEARRPRQTNEDPEWYA